MEKPYGLKGRERGKQKSRSTQCPIVIKLKDNSISESIFNIHDYVTDYTIGKIAAQTSKETSLFIFFSIHFFFIIH